MIIRVEWEDHDRVYRFPLDKFLKKLNIKVTKEELEKVADQLLRANE